MTRMIVGSTAAMLLLVSQPCFAAELLRDGASREHRIGAFVGGSVRLGFGGTAKAPRPDPRLNLGFARHDTEAAGQAGGLRMSGLSVGQGRRGAPTLFVGPTEVGDFQNKLGVSTGGAIAIGAGVAVVALLALVAASGTPDAGCGLADDPDNC